MIFDLVGGVESAVYIHDMNIMTAGTNSEYIPKLKIQRAFICFRHLYWLHVTCYAHAQLSDITC